MCVRRQTEYLVSLDAAGGTVQSTSTNSIFTFHFIKKIIFILLFALANRVRHCLCMHVIVCVAKFACTTAMMVSSPCSLLVSRKHNFSAAQGMTEYVLCVCVIPRLLFLVDFSVVGCWWRRCDASVIRTIGKCAYMHAIILKYFNSKHNLSTTNDTGYVQHTKQCHREFVDPNKYQPNAEWERNATAFVVAISLVCFRKWI